MCVEVPMKTSLILSTFFLTVLCMTQHSARAESAKDALITHRDPANLVAYHHQEHVKRIETSELSIPKDQALAMLKKLSEFELGRFLLTNKGLSGYWTSYVIRQALDKDLANDIEHWIVHESPVVVATRERSKHFQTVLQSFLKSGMSIASVPCGIMDDLVFLDYEDIDDIKLFGIDLDADSLKHAKQNAQGLLARKNVTVHFSERDAWNLGVDGQLDIIVSNGLNIYEPDVSRVRKLFAQFYKALKPGGTLVTSFLTPPPVLSPESPWKNFDGDNLAQQKVLFAEVIGVGWQSYRTEAEARADFEDVGFVVDKIIYDHQCMFPTIICHKPDK